MLTRRQLRLKRKHRIRAVVGGSGLRPRLAVFRSNQCLSAQLIDDEKHATLASETVEGKNKTHAKALGEKIIKVAKAKKISSVVFDRGGFRYHGVIKVFADAVREGGITF